MEERQKQEKGCLEDVRSSPDVSITAVFKALCMTGMEDTAVNILMYKTEITSRHKSSSQIACFFLTLEFYKRISLFSISNKSRMQWYFKSKLSQAGRDHRDA